MVFPMYAKDRGRREGKEKGEDEGETCFCCGGKVIDDDHTLCRYCVGHCEYTGSLIEYPKNQFSMTGIIPIHRGMKKNV